MPKTVNNYRRVFDNSHTSLSTMATATPMNNVFDMAFLQISYGGEMAQPAMAGLYFCSATATNVIKNFSSVLDANNESFAIPFI